mmetsp:Transcript_25196/g.57595  ORF Transcript_25196/g.57595 Transcript_25196/m.57595 type:complete len:257 (+) Transcript_25196:210-980(+)
MGTTSSPKEPSYVTTVPSSMRKRAPPLERDTKSASWRDGWTTPSGKVSSCCGQGMLPTSTYTPSVGGSGGGSPRLQRSTNSNTSERASSVAAMQLARSKPCADGPTSIIRPCRPTEHKYGDSACVKSSVRTLKGYCAEETPARRQAESHCPLAYAAARMPKEHQLSTIMVQPMFAVVVCRSTTRSAACPSPAAPRHSPFGPSASEISLARRGSYPLGDSRASLSAVNMRFMSSSTKRRLVWWASGFARSVSISSEG